jgi:hypothetical protein
MRGSLVGDGIEVSYSYELPRIQTGFNNNYVVFPGLWVKVQPYPTNNERYRKLVDEIEDYAIGTIKGNGPYSEALRDDQREYIMEQKERLSQKS